jgi:hypothetical protein
VMTRDARVMSGLAVAAAALVSSARARDEATAALATT